MSRHGAGQYRLAMHSILLPILSAAVAASSPVTPEDIISRIDTGAYRADATFSVTMPQLPDDVVYSLTINQTPAPDDTICPTAYLIDWAITQRPGMTAPSPSDHGFTAYFSGNHYNLIAERLRERHAESDPDAFMRPQRGGVAVTSQFADLVPSIMAARLRDMNADPHYTLIAVADTTVGGEKAVALIARMTVDGTVASEGEYLFYPGERLTPRRIVLENNTGSISEQTVTTKFSRPAEAGSSPAPVSEDQLIAAYPDEFERFRTSSYRLETLPGRHLPAIAVPIASGRLSNRPTSHGSDDDERYTRTASQSLDAPTVIVLLEAKSEFTPKVIEAVRDAARQLPWRIDILWTFTDTNPDDVEAAMPAPGTNELVLMSARSVARDCGAGSMLPAIVFAGRDGIVTDFTAGYNNSLSSDVLKKMMGLKP